MRKCPGHPGKDRMIPVDSSLKNIMSVKNHDANKISECRQSCTIKAVFSPVQLFYPSAQIRKTVKKFCRAVGRNRRHSRRRCRGLGHFGSNVWCRLLWGTPIIFAFIHAPGDTGICKDHQHEEEKRIPESHDSGIRIVHDKKIPAPRQSGIRVLYHSPVRVQGHTSRSAGLQKRHAPGTSRSAPQRTQRFQEIPYSDLSDGITENQVEVISADPPSSSGHSQR